MSCPRGISVLGSQLLALGAMLCTPGFLSALDDVCDSNDCLNGGTCYLSQNFSSYCVCPKGYEGLICNETENVPPCFPNPCQNEGKCQVIEEEENQEEMAAQYICKCPAGFLGLNCETACTMPLGMETGEISDAQLSASSMRVGYQGMQRWAPQLARLHRTGIVNAWTASNYDKNPWIQVDLRQKFQVTGVLTQGASRAGISEYIKSFKVAYSPDGHRFQFIKDLDGTTDKVFWGNVDNKVVKVNFFETPLDTQYVRLLPVICHRGCTLRFELVGCKLTKCSEPLGMKDNSIQDNQITASSIYKTWGLNAFSWYPFYARLDRKGQFNAWTAKTNSPTEWLQVDLGAKKQVTGIITQGATSFGHVQFVAAYKLAYSDDSLNWNLYEDPGETESKIFQGNKDSNSYKRNEFELPFSARFVRILPVAWHNRITLRLELLGC